MPYPMALPFINLAEITLSDNTLRIKTFFVTVKLTSLNNYILEE